MSEDLDIQAVLRQDYERIALTGVKRAGEARDAASIDRLVEAGLAERVGEEFSLNLPSTARVELDDATHELLTALHDYWLRADSDARDDAVLYGDLGYWRHWWNMLQSKPDRTSNPLRMDMVVADDEHFVEREWLAEFDKDIVEFVANGKLITGRVIVPPATAGTAAEDLIEFAITLGMEVRVFSCPTQFAIYDGIAAVLREAPESLDDLERHVLTHRAAVVEPLRRLFELQWAAGIPWAEYEKGGHGILRLLALGWTDTRIASATGVSVRTVSRRISEIMAAAGVQSRFELGMRYGLQQLDDVTR